jgi:hypothetical protein
VCVWDGPRPVGVTRRERTETGVKQNMQLYVETSKGGGDPTRGPRSSRSGTQRPSQRALLLAQKPFVGRDL